MASYPRGEAARRIWRKRLRRYERSSLSVKEFCAREGISLPSLYQWKKRLADSEDTRGVGPRPQFQPVQVVADSSVTVEFGDLVSLRIPSSQVALVRAVVAELADAAKELGSC